MTNEELISAAKEADWMQVVGNGGPPCFHYEADRRRFCLRAQRWFGHADQPTDVDHQFVSLADLLQTNFPRSSQNQTVSSGVEGAHEGTTADENGESREPEKLNAADKSVALAESSLSSPLADAIEFAKQFPLTRCEHGKALRDASGEALEPPCGCRLASPELLPTQLAPISKHSLSPEPQSTQPDTGKEKE